MSVKTECSKASSKLAEYHPAVKHTQNPNSGPYLKVMVLLNINL